MIAYRDEKRNVHQHASFLRQYVSILSAAGSANLLYNQEPLIEVHPDRPDAPQHQHTQDGESSDSASLFLLTKNRKAILDMITNPKRAVNDSA